MYWWLVAVAVASWTAGVALYRSAGPAWVSIFLFLFGGLSMIAFFDAVLGYLTLKKKTLEFKKNFKKTTILRSDISKVTWEKGYGVSVQLNEGELITLPSFGQNIQGLANSVRAWLKDT